MIMALIYRNVPRKTNEMLLLGERLTAEEAREAGIVNTQFLFHRREKRQLVDDDSSLSFCANREIIGQLMFVLLMFFEDLSRPRRHA